MISILLLISFPLSFLLIFKGSDWLTDSLEPLAARLQTSNIAIGLIVVSVIVSLPEILIAVDASLRGYDDISLGVIFGSIIANIGLMTGLSGMIRPLRVSRTIILRDGIMSLMLPLLLFGISQQGVISRLNGFMLCALFIPYVINIMLQERQAPKVELRQQKMEVKKELSLIEVGLGKVPPGPIGFLLGAGLLLYGSYFFTDQLILLTEVFSINQIFIGLTLGAIVPSIPNVAAAIQATQKGMTDVAVSETIGSNVFTLLVTLGITAIISPITIQKSWLSIDLPILFLMSIALVTTMITGYEISKKEAFFLFASYMLILGIQTAWMK